MNNITMKMKKIKILLFIGLIISFTPIMLISNSNETLSDAVSFIENNTKKVLDLKNSNKLEADKNRILRSIFDEIIDAKWLAGFSLGKHWHQITPEQKIAYRGVYSDYIFSSYLRKFNDFTATSYNVLNAKASTSNYFVVNMVTTNPDGKEIDITFRLKKIDNQFKIRDIVVEGISNAQAQRSEFSSIVSDNGFEHLIQILKSKV